VIGRAVRTLAAFAAGTVLLGPLTEVVFYGTEGFPAGAGRLVSAMAAVALVSVGAAAAFRAEAHRRGWWTLASALTATGLLALFAPLDAASAYGELHPAVRPVAALVAGVAIGACAAAVLPARPGEGDPAPVAALAAGVMLPTIPRVPPFPEINGYRDDVTWPLVAATVLAFAAALVSGPARAAGPRLVEVAAVAAAGALAGAAFHTGYVDRAVAGAATPAVVAALAGTVALWAALVAAVVWWSARAAGPAAARFALLCAGGTGVLTVNLRGDPSTFLWAPLGVVATVAAVVLVRRRPAGPWEAAGLAVTAVLMLAATVFFPETLWLPALGAVTAGFAFGAALGRIGAADAVYGLAAVMATVPTLLGAVGPLGELAGDPPGTAGQVLTSAPIWLTGLLTAAILALRQGRPARTAVPPPAPA